MMYNDSAIRIFFIGSLMELDSLEMLPGFHIKVKLRIPFSQFQAKATTVGSY